MPPPIKGTKKLHWQPLCSDWIVVATSKRHNSKVWCRSKVSFPNASEHSLPEHQKKCVKWWHVLPANIKIYCNLQKKSTYIPSIYVFNFFQCFIHPPTFNFTQPPQKPGPPFTPTVPTWHFCATFSPSPSFWSPDVGWKTWQKNKTPTCSVLNTRWNGTILWGEAWFFIR